MSIESGTNFDDRGKRSITLKHDIKKAVLASKKQTPSSLDIPAFLMNFPFTVDNETVNNALMKNENKPYNYKKAFNQFMELYHIIAEDAVVYLLPSEYQLQDLPFVANIGAFLPNVKPDTIIVANFKSPPRKGEDKLGIKFFDMMNYAVFKPTTTWEGEADLKWIKKNLYIGGYGIRTDIKSYHSMSDKFDMDIITIKMNDPKLYHFDCQFFPITEDQALVTTQVFSPSELRKIEKHLEIIEVPKRYMYDGWTNAARLGKRILCGIAPDPGSNKAHDKIIEKLGYKPVGVELGEFAKSGGDLSCLLMHLSYMGRL